MGRWELVEDGYHREQRFVENGTGLILGCVRGSVHDNSGWGAFTDGAQGPKRVGLYVTEDLAKKAVEQAQSTRGEEA